MSLADKDTPTSGPLALPNRRFLLLTCLNVTLTILAIAFSAYTLRQTTRTQAMLAACRHPVAERECTPGMTLAPGQSCTQHLAVIIP